MLNPHNSNKFQYESTNYMFQQILKVFLWSLLTINLLLAQGTTKSNIYHKMVTMLVKIYLFSKLKLNKGLLALLQIV